MWLRWCGPHPMREVGRPGCGRKPSRVGHCRAHRQRSRHRQLRVPGDQPRQPQHVVTAALAGSGPTGGHRNQNWLQPPGRLSACPAQQNVRGVAEVRRQGRRECTTAAFLVRDEDAAQLGVVLPRRAHRRPRPRRREFRQRGRTAVRAPERTGPVAADAGRGQHQVDQFSQYLHPVHSAVAAPAEAREGRDCGRDLRLWTARLVLCEGFRLRGQRSGSWDQGA